MVYYPDYRPTKPVQTTTTTTETIQAQSQGIFIKDSSSVAISQQELQTLIVLQIALQAALSAIIIAFDLNGNDDDVVQLQKIIESVQAFQVNQQRIVIKDSYNVAINQQQTQVDALIQAAITLLARIKVKFIEF